MPPKKINRCLFCKYIKSIFNNALLGYCVNTLTKLTETYCAITTHFSWRKVDSLWSSHMGLNNIKSIASWSVKAHLQILFFNKVLKLQNAKNWKNYAYVKILIFLLILDQTDCSKICTGHYILIFHNAMSIS